jgi:hypothetical protein
MGKFQKAVCYFIGVIAAAAPASVCASSAAGGKVTNLSVGSDGTVWFSYTGTSQGTLPSCAEANGLWMIDQSQAGYQGLLAALLSAQARSAVVSIQGTSECGTHTHERVAYLVIPN